MKNYIAIALCALLISLTQASAQKLIRNETDRFLKVHVKETSWEVLIMPFRNALRQRIKSIDGKKYLELRVTLHGVFRIDEGDNAYFLFDNDKSIPIKCTRGAVAGFETDYWYGDFLYEITPEWENAVLNSNLVAVRVELADEYKVFDNAKPKNAVKLRKALLLVTDNSNIQVGSH